MYNCICLYIAERVFIYFIFFFFRLFVRCHLRTGKVLVFYVIRIFVFDMEAAGGLLYVYSISYIDCIPVHRDT